MSSREASLCWMGCSKRATGWAWRAGQRGRSRSLRRSRTWLCMPVSCLHAHLHTIPRTAAHSTPTPSHVTTQKVHYHIPHLHTPQHNTDTHHSTTPSHTTPHHHTPLRNTVAYSNTTPAHITSLSAPISHTTPQHRTTPSHTTLMDYTATQHRIPLQMHHISTSTVQMGTSACLSTRAARGSRTTASRQTTPSQCKSLTPHSQMSRLAATRAS
mmetsp:Transcript_27343/g.62746  ORF Transcript_27343/g.62746 Transcript_27343/m.62746 type:complete len:213 (-) Transcript_27343:978-1616(-)